MATEGKLKLETSVEAYDIIVEYLEELKIVNARIEKQGKKTFIYDNYEDYDEDFIYEEDIEDKHYINVIKKLSKILSECSFSAHAVLHDCGIESGFFAKQEKDYLVFAHYDEDFISYDNIEKLSEKENITISDYPKCISIYQNNKKVNPKKFTDEMIKTANGLLEEQKEYVLEMHG